MKIECTIEEFFEILKKVSNENANDTFTKKCGLNQNTNQIPPHIFPH